MTATDEAVKMATVAARASSSKLADDVGADGQHVAPARAHQQPIDEKNGTIDADQPPGDGDAGDRG